MRTMNKQPPKPTKSESENPPQTVYFSRPTEPVKPVVSQEIKKKHDRSKKLYPNLNLSEGEYVIREVRRHPVGLAGPFAVGIILIAIIVLAMLDYDFFVNLLGLRGDAANISTVIWPLLLFSVLVVLGMYVVYYVYSSNRFFLTNESVIQENQTSLFSRHEQTVSLANIEDTSYRQHGILQYFLDYGSIRLSTEGDETTYRFSYVARPKECVAVLNNAVEAFKNGRPINGDN